MKTKNIILKDSKDKSLLYIYRGSDWASLTRRPRKHGMLEIVFSNPITTEDADAIDRSGIAHVENFTPDGTIAFTPKSFYEHLLMVDLIIDIFIRHETKRTPLRQMA